VNRASERKRRQVHRGEVHGQLPFETRGMDDPVPTIDFSPSGNLDAQAYSLEREDVDGTLLLPWHAPLHAPPRVVLDDQETEG